MEDWMLTCPTKHFLGVDCPGCGAQRALMHLLQGQFAEAFQLYPAIYPIVVLVGWIGLNQFKRTASYKPIRTFLLWFCAASIVLSYGYKMLL